MVVLPAIGIDRHDMLSIIKISLPPKNIVPTCQFFFTLDSIRRDKMLIELGGKDVYLRISFKEERLDASDAGV